MSYLQHSHFPTRKFSLKLAGSCMIGRINQMVWSGMMVWHGRMDDCGSRRMMVSGRRLCNYSEQKNCPTKGQISLVRPIAAQITKVNLWEISITKVDILFFVVSNNKHLAFFVKFILTLRWDPFDGTVFLHTLKLALHIYIT